MNLIQKILLESELENEFDINSFLEPNPNQLERYKQELERRKKVLEPFIKNIKLGLKKINKASENKEWKSEEEKLFLELFYKSEVGLNLEEYPNLTFIIKNDKIFAYQDLKNKIFWIDYDSIWKAFKYKFHWSYEEIKLFLRVMEKKYFKLENFDVIL